MTPRDRLLDDQVWQADPERWLSSRFVSDEQARADLIALYAFEAELMAIPTRVTQPLLAEMRYTWWAEQLDGVFAGAARRGHPVLETLTDIVARHGLERAPFDSLVDAHIDRIHARLQDLDALHVGPMQVAVQVLAGRGHDQKVVHAGRMRGLTQTGKGMDAVALRSAANLALRRLPAAAFPAVSIATLTAPEAPESIKRLRLIWANLMGRV